MQSMVWELTFFETKEENNSDKGFKLEKSELRSYTTFINGPLSLADAYFHLLLSTLFFKNICKQNVTTCHCKLQGKAIVFKDVNCVYRTPSVT